MIEFIVKFEVRLLDDCDGQSYIVMRVIKDRGFQSFIKVTRALYLITDTVTSENKGVSNSVWSHAGRQFGFQRIDNTNSFKQKKIVI